MVWGDYGAPQGGTITTEPGIDALVLECRWTGSVRIGRLGTQELPPGFYVYVGSAYGPGGVAARKEHHRQIANRRHWHMNYLWPACDLLAVGFRTDTASQEHAWAYAVARLSSAAVPMPSFGSSNCQCKAHLFWFARLPSVRTLRQRVKTKLDVYR